MPRLFRTLCVSLCAALVAVLCLHGVQDGQHQIAHASDWQTAAITEGDHAEGVMSDHGSHVIDVYLEAPVDDALDQTENTDGDGNAGRPSNHHHHSGGDNHTAIPVLGRDVSPLIATSAMVLQPAVDGARPGRTGDGPEYPPKRLQTII
ncbi:hypothetical protein KOAAANKH_02065 [Brevundimonas sp. NIBR10]|uniref:hypothetical protein n=1 Tax=Brevundimonas sp. NIBR10 TaxID=3015997 RepID=UPI0022F1A904|nr:hypothetical protein [Brevundimonas sp. NIBR10]WGM47190.1 hypothetical protein KOAAANKH_02065 [Brevundimonas sp. NIBR10]